MVQERVQALKASRRVASMIHLPLATEEKKKRNKVHISPEANALRRTSIQLGRNSFFR